MRKIITTIGLCLLMMNTLVVAQEITSEVEQRAREIVSRMTLQEKIEYISGYTSFSLRAIPRLGIPEIKLAESAIMHRRALFIRPVSFPLLLGTGNCSIN